MTLPTRPPSPEALLEHREWLRAIARSLVVDESAVDDVEQRTWLAVLRNQRPVTSVRAWLRSVVRNAASDTQRSEARRRAREAGVARSEALPPTEHLVLQLEAQRAVAQAVSVLPEPYRTTVLLRHIEELAVKEVAERMSVPVKTVHTRLRRAHALLRDALDREFGDRRTWCLALLPLVTSRPPIGAAAGGALVMAAKMKLVAAAVAVVALGAGMWWVADSVGSGDGRVQEQAASLTPAERPERNRSAPSVAPETVRPAPAGTTVSVEVVDGMGRGILNARVELRRAPGAASNQRDWFVLLRARHAPAGESRAVVTSQAGAAELTDIAAGEWRMLVSATGFAAHEQSVFVESEPVGRRVVMLPGCTLQGRVVDSAGGGVARADVFVDGSVARAGPDGSFRLDGLSPGTHDVRVGVPGGATQGRGEVSLPEVADITLTIVGGCALRGRIVDDETGTPLGGARVVFRAWRNDELPSQFQWGVETTTSADGTFAWSDLPPGVPYGLWVLHDDYPANRDGLLSAPPDFQLMSGRVASIEVRMRRGASVRGRVLGPDAAPISGAVVDVHTAWGDGRIAISEPALSGADGRFSVLARTGTALVRVRARGARQRELPASLIAAVRAGTIPAACRVEVVAGGSAVIDIVMDPVTDTPAAGVLSGVVRREDGLPCGTVVLELLPSRWGTDTPRKSVAGPGGAFRFEGLRGERYVLRASAPGCAPGRVSGLALPESRELEGVELALARELTIKGRVVDAEGGTVAGAEISLVAAASRARQGATRATTGTDGAFTVGRLGSRDWRVSVRRSGFVTTNETVAAGTENVEIRLDRGLSIAGVVVDGDSGEPIAGVPIAANYSVYRPGYVLNRLAATDPEGRFRLTGLPADVYTLWVGRDGDSTATGEFVQTSVADVRAGTEGVRVVLTRGVAIEGRVVDADGAPVRDGHVAAFRSMKSATAPGLRARRARIARDGSFRLVGLESAPHDVEATPLDASGRPMSPVRLVDVPAGTRDIELRARPALVIEGRLVLENGKPLPSAAKVEIRFTSDTGMTSEQLMTWSRDGRFRTRPLEPDRVYDIVVTQVKDHVGAALRGVPAGTRDVVVVVRVGGRIEGRVIDAAGHPVQTIVKASIAKGSTWPPEPGASSFVKSGADGRFVLTGLLDAPYRISAGGTPSEFLRVRLPEPVRPGAEVELRVERGAVVSGRLVDAEGTALKAGVVQLTRQGNFVSVDDEGRFSIRGVKPGAYPLFAHFGRRVVPLGEVDAPSEGLEFTIGAE